MPKLKIMRLKSKYKLRLLIISLLFLIILFLISLFIPKNYTSNYKYKKYSISETYNKKTKIYKFSISKNKTVYKLNIKNSYTHKRHHITKIVSNGDCIIVSLFNIKRNICINDDTYITSYINDELNTNVVDTYKNVDIYDYNDDLFYIWNYNNFIILSKDKNSTLDLFNSDEYELDYITLVDDYLLIADYDSKYFFQQFILLDSKNRNYEYKKLKRELSYEGYILGTFDNYVYIYDDHYEKTFKYNPFKETFYNSSNGIYVNNKWEDLSVNKLNKHTYYFKNSENYYIKDNKLYFNDYGIKVLVFSENIDRIIKIANDEIYFVSDGKLYYNNFYKGTKLLLSYSEWDFNNKNIYIFDN